MRSRVVERFVRECVFDENGCLLWTGARHGNGYGLLTIAPNHRAKLRAHRVSYEIFVGPVGDKWVLHKCDTPLCVNPDHLFLGTDADNKADKIAKGRGWWKIPPSAYPELEIALKTNSVAVVAANYGVHWAHLHKLIKTGRIHRKKRNKCPPTP